MWMQIVYYYDGAQRYEQFLQVSQLCGFLLLGLALYHPSASVSLVFIVLTEWASYTLATERSIPLVPVNNISVEESYQRFCGAIQKAARHSIPRGFRPTSHIVESCPLTKLNGGLSRLHSADEDAVSWLTNYGK